MNEHLTAKPIIKNKFWVVEKDGRQVGTIQAIDEGGYTFVSADQRTFYPTIRAIKKHHNIILTSSTPKKKKQPIAREIYGYPCHATPYGAIFNLKKHLPIYSLNTKSKSYYCAGYYLVNYTGSWVLEFCPKLIVLNRYQFDGPFSGKDEAQIALKGKTE